MVKLSCTVGLLLLAIACAKDGRHLASAPPPAKADAGGRDADIDSGDATVDFGGIRPAHPPVLSGCVVGSGESHTRTHRTKRPGGRPGPVTEAHSCEMDAACVDGIAGITCADRSCVCTLTPTAPSGTAFTFRIETERPCSTTAEARALLRAHCLPLTGR